MAAELHYHVLSHQLGLTSLTMLMFINVASEKNCKLGTDPDGRIRLVSLPLCPDSIREASHVCPDHVHIDVLLYLYLWQIIPIHDIEANSYVTCSYLTAGGGS